MLGRPLSGVDSRPGECLIPVGGRNADCGFNADPGRYAAVCGHAVLGRPKTSVHFVVCHTNKNAIIFSS